MAPTCDTSEKLKNEKIPPTLERVWTEYSEAVTFEKGPETNLDNKLINHRGESGHGEPARELEVEGLGHHQGWRVKL